MDDLQPKSEIDLEKLAVDGAMQIVREMKDLSVEETDIIRRATHRLAEIGVLSIGANSATLASLQVERNTCVATLLSLLEAKGVDAQHKIESFVTGLLYKAIDVVLGRLGL